MCRGALCKVRWSTESPQVVPKPSASPTLHSSILAFPCPRFHPPLPGTSRTSFEKEEHICHQTAQKGRAVAAAEPFPIEMLTNVTRKQKKEMLGEYCIR